LIQLTEKQWGPLCLRLREEHPPSVFMIRDVMRRELGFTTRHHREWNGTYYDWFVCLDFYDDRLESWFVLKYAEYL
jgi:hypothetical protein